MNFREKFLIAGGKRDLLRSQLESAQQHEVDLREQARNVELAQAFLQSVAQETQRDLKIRVEKIVQLALDTVWPGSYQFQIEFELKRGKTEARIFLLENGWEYDPMSQNGGGLVDVLALALRITAYTLGGTANTLIFDEPMKFVSRDLQERASEIIKVLSKHLGIQFIISTHVPEIIESSDKVFRVVKDQETRRSFVSEEK